MIQTIGYYRDFCLSTAESILSKGRAYLLQEESLHATSKHLGVSAAVLQAGIFAYSIPELAAYLPSSTSFFTAAGTASIIGMAYLRQRGFTIMESIQIPSFLICYLGQKACKFVESIGISASLIRDLLGNPPSSLHDVVSDEDVLSIKGHLLLGAEVNSKNAQGTTPLYYAVFPPRKRKIMTLIDHGADLLARNNRNESPLFHLISPSLIYPPVSLDNSEWESIENALHNSTIQKIDNQCIALLDSFPIPFELISGLIRGYLLKDILRENSLFMDEGGRIRIKRSN